MFFLQIIFSTWGSSSNRAIHSKLGIFTFLEISSVQHVRGDLSSWCIFLTDSNMMFSEKQIYVYVRSTPHPVTVTTRIITFLVGNPYKPSFATVTGWGVDPTYMFPILGWIRRAGCKFIEQIEVVCFACFCSTYLTCWLHAFEGE